MIKCDVHMREGYHYMRNITSPAGRGHNIKINLHRYHDSFYCLLWSKCKKEADNWLYVKAIKTYRFTSFQIQNFLIPIEVESFIFQKRRSSIKSIKPEEATQ